MLVELDFCELTGFSAPEMRSRLWAALFSKHYLMQVGQDVQYERNL